MWVAKICLNEANGRVSTRLEWHGPLARDFMGESVEQLSQLFS